jgi:hypothetical protein
MTSEIIKVFQWRAASAVNGGGGATAFGLGAVLVLGAVRRLRHRDRI